MPRRLLVLPLLAAALTGCSSGASCDELPALTERRDAARAQYEAVTKQSDRRQGGEEEVDAAHDVMHDLDKRVFELADRCR